MYLKFQVKYYFFIKGFKWRANENIISQQFKRFLNKYVNTTRRKEREV